MMLINNKCIVCGGIGKLQFGSSYGEQGDETGKVLKRIYDEKYICKDCGTVFTVYQTAIINKE